MTNQNERPVSTLLRIGIFLVPGIFSWFTLRKGYSSIARIASFSWLLILLYVGYPTMKEEAKVAAMSFGFLPEHVKAQQCLTVSRYLPENEASVMREASSKKIDDWLRYKSGCSDPMRCMQQRQALSTFVEQKSAPNQNNVDRDIIKKWRDSEYCQALVSSYQNILATDKQTTTKLTEPAKLDLFRIKLYFEQRGDNNKELVEAVDFQKNKVADFCYDTQELNNIKLEGISNINDTLIILKDEKIIFEKKNLVTESNAIIYNKDIGIEPGPVSFQVKVLHDNNIIFQGNVESSGCS